MFGTGKAFTRRFAWRGGALVRVVVVLKSKTEIPV